MKIFVPNDYITTGRNEFDYALVILDRPVGLETGWIGSLCANNAFIQNQKIRVTGYPGDKGCKKMYSMKHDVTSLSAERIAYIIDTVGGQSGSPVWCRYAIRGTEVPLALAVHTHGEMVFPEGNSGTRLTELKMRELLKLINAHWATQPTPQLLLENAKSDLIIAADKCYRGLEVPQDFIKAIGLYENALTGKQSDDRAKASLRLGECNLFGYGLVANPDEARKYFTSAADQEDDWESHAWANYWLGKICFVEGNYKEARAYLKKAASIHASPDAQVSANFLLAIMDYQRHGLVGEPEYGQLVEKVISYGEHNFEDNTEAAHLTAQRWLGQIYLDGKTELGQDLKLASTCLEKVAKRSANLQERADAYRLLSKVYALWGAQ